MKIVIVGPGAMGCLIAAYLCAKTKEEVWLFDKDAVRAQQLQNKGLIVEEAQESIRAKVRATARSADIGIADLAIICTKSYSTDSACQQVRGIFGEKTLVLTLQNGIGNVQILSEYFKAGSILCGVTNHGSTLLGTGHVRHAGRGETIIGRPDGKVTRELKDVQAIFNRAGFETKISKNIDSVVWSKLIVNVGINALTALTNLQNGRLIEYDGTKEIMREAISEAARIAKRKRIRLIYDDPIQKAETVCRATAANIASMLQDVMNHKRTEIEYINGAIVRLGKGLSIETPVNAVLTHLIRTIESSYDIQVARAQANA